MKKLSIYAGLMALSVTSGAALYAAPGKADQDGNRIVTKAEAIAAGDARFAKMDANNDGVLNAADRTTMMTKRFAKMDADNNGSISQSEFMAVHEARTERREDRQAKRSERGQMGAKGSRRGGRGMAMMTRADTNNDKAVSQAEFRAAVEARFAKADANNDGSITMDERKAGRKGNWGGRNAAPVQPNGG